MTDAELLAQIEAAIAAHPGARVVQSGSDRVEYPDLQELIDQRDALNAKIAAETGTWRRRTLAKNAGSGL
jgi:hypothetical protein